MDMRGTTCRRKRVWRFKKDAAATALQASRDRGHAFKAYQCDDCRKWHVATVRYGGEPVLFIDTEQRVGGNDGEA